MKRLLLIFAAALPLQAATTFDVSAKFADVPAGTEVTASTSKLEKMRGVNVLSAPKVTVASGDKATIEVTQSQSAPGGASVPLGVTLEVTPTQGEKAVAFTGRATDRAMHGKRSDGGVNVVEFATREIYFSGATTSGETVVIHTAAAVSKGSKDSTTTARELVILLTLTKKTTEPEQSTKSAKSKTTKKPEPAKKAEPVKKTATSKITPVKKKK